MTPPGLRATSKVVNEWRYPLVDPNKSGLLEVDNRYGHKLYWEEYGSPRGEPVIVLHGGPGGACNPSMARYFNPDRYRVILFDQRGCGQSEPTVASAGPVKALSNNTTDHLVEDINRLREYLGVTDRSHLFGGSWGSTLAMVYAIRYPEFARSLVLRGVFMGDSRDLRYMYQGNASSYHRDPLTITEPGSYIFYPEEWRDFVETIEADDRHDMMLAYKRIFDQIPGDERARAQQLKAALAWSVWEGKISNMIPDNQDTGKFGRPDFALSFAQIEAHFFANNLFLEEHYILKNIARLASTPVHIVHGRFDQVSPLAQAFQLAAALGSIGVPPVSFVKTSAGHSALEAQNVIALTAVMDSMPRQA